MEFKEVQSLGNVGLVCKQADCLTCFYCKVHISVWSGGDEKSVAHSQFRACPNAVFSFQNFADGKAKESMEGHILYDFKI